MTEDIHDLLPLVLRPKDASEALGVSIDYARRLFHSPGFPSIAIGKRRVISQKSFLTWLEGMRVHNGI